jgi:hypothetical protein
MPMAFKKVEVIEVSLPTNNGLTLRGHLHSGGPFTEYVFPTDDNGTLLLFSDVSVLSWYAAQHRHADPLFATPPAGRPLHHPEDLIFDLDLLVEQVGAPPDNWSRPLFCRCRDLCAQLSNFLELDEAQDALDKDTPIDIADDILRKAGATLSRGSRRRLHQLDLEFLAEEWEHVVAVLDAASRTIES